MSHRTQLHPQQQFLVSPRLSPVHSRQASPARTPPDQVDLQHVTPYVQPPTPPQTSGASVFPQPADLIQVGQVVLVTNNAAATPPEGTDSLGFSHEGLDPGLGVSGGSGAGLMHGMPRLLSNGTLASEQRQHSSTSFLTPGHYGFDNYGGPGSQSHSMTNSLSGTFNSGGGIVTGIPMVISESSFGHSQGPTQAAHHHQQEHLGGGGARMTSGVYSPVPSSNASSSRSRTPIGSSSILPAVEGVVLHPPPGGSAEPEQRESSQSILVPPSVVISAGGGGRGAEEEGTTPQSILIPSLVAPPPPSVVLVSVPPEANPSSRNEEEEEQEEGRLVAEGSATAAEATGLRQQLSPTEDPGPGGSPLFNHSATLTPEVAGGGGEGAPPATAQSSVRVVVTPGLGIGTSTPPPAMDFQTSGGSVIMEPTTAVFLDSNANSGGGYEDRAVTDEERQEE